MPTTESNLCKSDLSERCAALESVLMYREGRKGGVHLTMMINSMTDDTLLDPTLPGTIPGMLQMGSLVYRKGLRGVHVVCGVWSDSASLDHATWCDGFAVSQHDADGVHTVHVPAGPTMKPVVREPLTDIQLALAHATSRLHALQWAATKLGMEQAVVGAGALWLSCTTGVRGASLGWGRWTLHAERSWGASAGFVTFCAPGTNAGSRDPRPVVPALADLDPTDDRRLPDGSRWVDAMALMHICLHLAGVERA